MNPSKPYLFLAVIFLAGMVAGSALTVGLSSHFLRPPGAQQMKKHWLNYLTEQLHLTPEQQVKIDPILDNADREIQAIHRDESGKISQIIAQTHQRIATVLTPEQQVELQNLQRIMEHNRDRMFPGFPGGHRGPHGEPDGGPPGMDRPPDGPKGEMPPPPAH